MQLRLAVVGGHSVILELDVDETAEIKSAIQAARAEEPGAIGALLQLHYNYLRFLAAAQLGQTLQRRVSPSDVVQETLLAAHRDFGSFRGTSVAEFTSWIKTILSRALVREFERHLTAGKRDIRREVSIDTVVKNMESSCIFAASLVAPKSQDPATIVSLDEETRRVANLIAQLPLDYQTIIMLKTFAGLENSQIAQRMDRSEQAVRLLWMRALRQLRQLALPNEDEK